MRQIFTATNPEPRETEMVRFECRECSMVAQGPSSVVFRDAWAAHMSSHVLLESEYDRYQWFVTHLPGC